MNKKPVFTSRFKKDYKRILKQGKDESEIILIRTGSHSELFR